MLKPVSTERLSQNKKLEGSSLEIYKTLEKSANIDKVKSN